MIDSATFMVDNSDVPALNNIITYLSKIGYCEAIIRERLGVADLAELLWRAVPIYREENLILHDSLDIAIDFFLLQGTISQQELNQLFNSTDQEILISAGLILIANDKCFARASLFPVGNTLIFSDHAWPTLPHPGFVEVPAEQIMSIGSDSRWLARTTVRRQVHSSLDLCTGSGVHALLAAAHSEHVVAVDINPRAAKCTNFNAKALGITNIETAVGDLFEPVVGEAFDLITANPPFVPSPLNSLLFRDGGASGEDVLKRIVAGLPQHLAPGGIAQIVTELGERENESLTDRLRLWLNGAPMDIIVHRLNCHTATSYAIGHANGNDTYETFLTSVEDWSSNLRTQGYTHIVSVLIAFQWSDLSKGPSFSRVEEAQAPHKDASDEITEIFSAEATSRLANLEELLQQHSIHWTSPIGIMESQVLGSELHLNTQVKLLGKELATLKNINLIEREILLLLENPMTLIELQILTREINMSDEDVFGAIVSLLKNQFIIFG